MEEKAINPDTFRTLDKLSFTEELNDFYLVGGTALALLLGHRDSNDVDLFSTTDFDSTRIKDLMDTIFEDYQIKTKGKNLLIGYANGVKVDFAAHKYPMIYPHEDYNNIKMASIQDIAAMKLGAIADRGVMRDFVDYVELLKNFSLKDMLGFFKKKYNQYNTFHVVKSLSYFDDAEYDPAFPKMNNKMTWKEVKSITLQSVREYQQQEGYSL